jgi:hypothetical protein
MLPKTSTLPLSEGDILHNVKLVSGAPRVFITPCQVSMTKEKNYAWAILEECLPNATHMSIALARGLVSPQYAHLWICIGASLLPSILYLG